MEVFLSKSPGETLEIAASFASTLKRNDVVALVGELGSGKTQFVKGICRFFGVHDVVTSPTFVMLHRYEGLDEFRKEILLYHFDLYRTTSPSEVYDLGYEEFFRGNGICMIEWADMLGDLMPVTRTDIRFSFGSGEQERRIEIHRLASATHAREGTRMDAGGAVS